MPSVAAYLGQRITLLREERGWSPYRLEKESGVPYNTLKRLEAGTTTDPGLGLLLHLVDVFGLCSIEELLGGHLGTRVVRDIGNPDNNHGDA